MLDSLVRRYPRDALGIREAFDQLYVLWPMNQRDLLVGRLAWRHQLAVLDQPCFHDQLESQLQAERLKRVVVGVAIFLKRLPVDQPNRARHRLNLSVGRGRG